MTASIKQTQISWPNPYLFNTPDAGTAAPVLKAIAAPIHNYRDGDVVLYKRAHSQCWQCRYKLLNGAWQRISTKQRNLSDAARRACELYDEARFRERNGLAAIARRFRDAAAATLVELRAALAAINTGAPCLLSPLVLSCVWIWRISSC